MTTDDTRTDTAPPRPRTGIRSGFTSMDSLDQVTPDPGFFGPDSVTWRIHHDPSSVLGGVRALMLQALHPDVMLAFSHVTSSDDDPWGRLSRTGAYLNAVTYGTRAEAEAAAERLRRVHTAVGVGRPDWLLWVHCGAVDSWLDAYRRSGARLTREEADQYVAEQVTSARLAGCDVADTPSSVSELAEYYRSLRHRLMATPEARSAVGDLIWPPMVRRVELLTPARPAWTTVALTAFGLLPRWARRMFAMPGLPTTDVQAALAARALRAGLLAVPDARRTNPHLAAARLRLGLADAA